MKTERITISIIAEQLRRLRDVWESIHKKRPSSAEFANTYTTLCTTIEYIVGEHLREELESLRTYVDNTAPSGDSEWIFRSHLDNSVYPYNQTRGREMALRLIGSELSKAETLTFSQLSPLRKKLCGESLIDFCNAIDFDLYNDLKGLYAVRNTYSHGCPIRLDADPESPHNFHHDRFSLNQTIKTLVREKLITAANNLDEQANNLREALFSYETICFYWSQTSSFAHKYVESIPKDIFDPSGRKNRLDSLRPLNEAKMSVP